MVRILARFMFFASSSSVCSSWRSMWMREGHSSSMTTFGCTLRITSDTSRCELSLKYTLAPSGVVSTVTVSGRCRSNSSSDPYTGIKGSPLPPLVVATLSIGMSDTLAVVSRESRSPPPVVTVSDVSEDCDMLRLASAGLGCGFTPVGSVSSSSEELTNESVTLFAVSEALRSRLSVLAVVFSALLVLLLLLLASPMLPLPAVGDCCRFSLLESSVELSVVSNALLYSDDELNGEDILQKRCVRMCGAA
uniref:Uncharacterized protein n=1 Tax=Anopheles albimanus TaxID=7167 RepID=A0A182FAS3_ANOAL